MSSYQGVFICGEISEGYLSAITAELLGVGQRIADQLGQNLHAVLIGSGVDTKLAQECI